MKYGFLGCGNMGGAIAGALRKSVDDIWVTDRTGRAKEIAHRLGLHYATAEEIVTNCDRIFLAVKPNAISQVLMPLQDILSKRKPILISMAAGVTMGQIEQMAGCALPVIRIMPNTPVAVGKGMTQYCCNDLVSPETETSFLSDMRYSGRLDKLEEKLMDAASALSGCGPAYLYLLMEAMADGAVACGLPRARAMEYAAATVIGAGEMALSSGLHPGALKDAVCSPGGSTIAGVRVLEERGIRGAVMDCVIAACEKSRELGK